MGTRDKSIEQKLKAEGKESPLEFLLRVMHNTKVPTVARMEAAKSAAPYIHKKMPLDLQHSGEIEFIAPIIPTRTQMRDMDPDFDDDLL